jgi:uncharacterized protein
MELSDEILIPAPREQVYAALNDAEILRTSVPECEELTKTSETELEARVVLKVGPVKAPFAGKVTLDPSGAPGEFALSGEGSGGAAGFAKGSATVQPEDRGAETLLRYAARAEIGGKLAQLGNRLVAGTARKLAGRFFDNFARQVAPQAASE